MVHLFCFAVTHYFLDSKTLSSSEWNHLHSLLTLDFVQKRQHNEELVAVSHFHYRSCLLLNIVLRRAESNSVQNKHNADISVKAWFVHTMTFYHHPGMCSLNSIDIVGNVVWNINYRYNNKLFIC